MPFRSVFAAVYGLLYSVFVGVMLTICVLRHPIQYVQQTALYIKNYGTQWDYFACKFAQKNTDSFLYHLIGAPPALLTRDPAMVEAVLSVHFDAFEKGPEFRTRFEPLLGHGIFNSDGDQWKFQRKIASHIFSSRSLRDCMTSSFSRHLPHLHEMITRTHTRGVEGKGVGTNGQHLDLQDCFYRFTFDSISDIAFGVSTGCLSSEVDVPFAHAFDAVQEYCQNQFTNPIFNLERSVGSLPLLGPVLFPAYNKAQARLKVLNQFAVGVVEDRLKDAECCIKTDLLSQLINYSRTSGEFASSVTVPFLRDTIMNYIIAGRDTTAVALTWAVHLISTHPHVQAKVIEEVDRVLGGRAPDYDSVKELPYLKAVILETLRLYPPVPIDVKMCTKATTLPSGHTIRPPFPVLYLIYAMGRDTSRWGPDAAQFRPERFIDAPLKRSVYEYPVFNAGPRTCLGQAMAMLEASMVLSSLYQKYTFESDPNHTVQYKITVSLPVKNGLLVRLVPRAASAITSSSPAPTRTRKTSPRCMEE